MSEEDKINNLTEKDIKGINGFIDFLDMLNDSDSLQKYKTTSQYTATEISKLTRESYYQGRADEAKKWKNKIKAMLQEITKEHSSILSNDKYSLNDKNIATFQYNAMRKILEELLEERN